MCDIYVISLKYQKGKGSLLLMAQISNSINLFRLFTRLTKTVAILTMIPSKSKMSFAILCERANQRARALAIKTRWRGASTL